ncbi:hypothetical protein PRIPAC_80783 [Pristionchus pacificus]|uniref:acid phosphatase n=1 Tax=Pristionchus pacificus TaxID=54126 RepID=A0A2A6C3M7_PRIPA|nr:hypothetical protein PRIPAC_80783 [Pristionchus pacificus]|eukprot:PDM72643.1 Phosphatase [Pristionchus pacificus]
MKTILHLFFSLAVALAADELLSVNVVIRHADRAATSGWATPQSSQILFRGNGELTDLGIDNAFDQGRDFQQRYVMSGFVDKRFLPSEVFIRSSAVNRCLMSAAAFTAGLFQQTSKGRSIVPPVFTKEQATDGLLVPLLTCGDGWQDVIARYNLSSNRNVQSAALIAMMQTQWPVACASVPPILVDAIIAEAPNPLINMPANYKACAEGAGKEFMYKARTSKCSLALVLTSTNFASRESLECSLLS